MNTETPGRQRWLALAGLVAVPAYVLPVGFCGVRALWPRVLRDAATGAIGVGMLSLVVMGLAGFLRVRAALRGGERWRRLPFLESLVPEDFAASAVSGY